MKSNTYVYPVLLGSPEGEPLADLSSHFDASGKAVFGAIRPLLNGKHSTEELYAKLAIAGFELGTVSQVLECLDSLNLLTNAPETPSGALTPDQFQRHRAQVEIFDQWLGEDPNVTGVPTKGHQTQARLGGAKVLIVGLENAGSALAKALARAGVGNLFGIPSLNQDGSHPEIAHPLAAEISSIDPSINFTMVAGPDGLPEVGACDEAAVLVYCPDRFDRHLCVQLNEISLNSGAPFILYQQTPFFVEIGPLVFPRQTACYICAELRRRGTNNSSILDDFLPPPSGAFNFPVGIDLLAVEIIKILTKVALPVSRGRIWRLNLRSGLSEVHPVLKLPRCVACGVHRKIPARKLWSR